MKISWTVEELQQHFVLQADEREFLGLNKPHNQLGKAVLLKVFQYEGRFPQEKQSIPELVVEFIAQQLYVLPEVWSNYGSVAKNTESVYADRKYPQTNTGNIKAHGKRIQMATL